MSEPIELNRSALRDLPLPPYPDADKTEHGYLVAIAGSRFTPGSASLCTSAALRSGVGQVTLISVESAAPALATSVPEAKIVPIGEADGGFGPAVTQAIRDHSKTCGAILGGPGVEPNRQANDIVRTMLDVAAPAVIDAGLLYSIASLEAECRRSKYPPILLPQAAEMAAILGCSEDAVNDDRLGCAQSAASRLHALVLGKGETSFLATPDGRSWVWRGGAPGLGIAGSGDTLAGIIGALLARGAEPLRALLWGVLLHGEAGESLSSRVGPIGFRAIEIPDEIPALLARQ